MTSSKSVTLDDSLRLAIFDVDGTLVDSQHNIVAAMHDAFDSDGLERPDPPAVRSIIGLSLVEAVATLMPGHDEDRIARVAEAYKNAFVTRRARPDFAEALFPGALEAIATLDKAGVLLGIATGKSRRGVESFLERHGLAGRFLTIQTADDGPGKPDPTMIRRAMAETGCQPDQTVMIGDTSYDMTMAVRAGAAGIGVVWGYHAPGDLMAAGARVVAADFPAVVAAAEAAWRPEG